MQDVCKIVKSKDIQLKGSDLIIELKPISLSNSEVFEVITTQNIPDTANHLNKVKIQIGTQLYSLFNVTGNYTRADQIKARTRYPVIFGVDPLHISLLKRIPASQFEYKELGEENV